LIFANLFSVSSTFLWLQSPSSVCVECAAVAKRQRQLAKTSGNGSLNSALFDPQQQQQQQQQQQNNQLNNPSLISSGNGAKKSRKSASKQLNNNHNTNNSNNNSQHIGGVDGTTRCPADSQWEQPHSRRNSAENHGHRNER